jgi:APA family basic amino acid/polyamine antiporter
MTPTKGELRRETNVVDAGAIFVGIILGSGVFVAPAQVTGAAPAPLGAIGLWLAGAVIAACGAFTYAECGARLPANGGFYVYYRAVYGEPLAFVGGWSATFVTYPASTAAIALLGAQYGGVGVPALADKTRWVATAAVLATGALNWAGVRTGATAQRLLTAFKVLTVLGVCVAALFAKPSAVAETLPPAASLAMVLTAMVSVLWSYDGWSDVTLITGELERPERNLARAVGIGVLTLFIVHVLVQLSVMALLPASVAAASPSVLADAVQAALGAGAASGLAAIVCVSTFGSVNGIVLTASRLGHAMSVDGVIPPWFSRLHPRRNTPTRTIAVMVVCTIVYVWASDFRGLLEFFGQTIWLFYGLTAVSALILRRRGRSAGFTAPWFAPWVVVTTALAMSIGLAIANPKRFFIGVALMSAASPAYLVWRVVKQRLA